MGATWMSLKREPARLGGERPEGFKGLTSAAAGHWSLACSGAGRASETGLPGRRACWVEGAGLCAPVAGGLAVASACGDGPVGSALMMLTGGIEADDGEKRPVGGGLGAGG